jgi:hypothetical protein
MKNAALYLTIGLAVFAAPFAKAEEAASKDEQKLERTSSEVDKDATQPEGQKAVEGRLKSEFKVDDARIQGLRDQKMGYGEISIALALAQKMPGGITDANVKTIMAERQGPPVMGWGPIAKKQGVSLGKVISGVKRVDAGARKNEKAESRKHEKNEKGEKSERAEKSERSERPERHEKSERPENPKH